MAYSPYDTYNDLDRGDGRGNSLGGNGGGGSTGSGAPAPGAGSLVAQPIVIGLPTATPEAPTVALGVPQVESNLTDRRLRTRANKFRSNTPVQSGIQI